MMATKKSPYSEMYLVSPAIYQRMLKCLDRSDVNIVENLNQPITIEEQKTPSEKFLEQIHSAEIEPNEEVQPIQQYIPQQIQNVLPISEPMDLSIQPMQTLQAPPLLPPDNVTLQAPNLLAHSAQTIENRIPPPLRLMSGDQPMPIAYENEYIPPSVVYHPSISQEAPPIEQETRYAIEQQQQQQQQPSIGVQQHLPISQYQQPSAITFQTPVQVPAVSSVVPAVSSVRQNRGGVLKISKPCSTALCQVDNNSPIAIPIQQKLIRIKTNNRKNRRKEHICYHCNRVFTRGWNLARHIYDVHRGKESVNISKDRNEVIYPIEEDNSDNSDNSDSHSIEDKKITFESLKQRRLEDRRTKNLPIEQDKREAITGELKKPLVYKQPKAITYRPESSFKKWTPISDRFGNVRKRNQPEIDVSIRKDPYGKKPSFTQWREPKPT